MAKRIPEQIRVPLPGDIELRRLSLPAMTLLLAALDGFNPCAMWTLVFPIGLVTLAGSMALAFAVNLVEAACCCSPSARCCCCGPTS